MAAVAAKPGRRRPRPAAAPASSSHGHRYPTPHSHDLHSDTCTKRGQQRRRSSGPQTNHLIRGPSATCGPIGPSCARNNVPNWSAHLAPQAKIGWCTGKAPRKAKAQARGTAGRVSRAVVCEQVVWKGLWGEWRRARTGGHARATVGLTCKQAEERQTRTSVPGVAVGQVCLRFASGAASSRRCSTSDSCHVERRQCPRRHLQDGRPCGRPCSRTAICARLSPAPAPRL